MIVYKYLCKFCDNDLLVGIRIDDVCQCTKCGEIQAPPTWEQLYDYEQNLPKIGDNKIIGAIVVFYDHSNLPESLIELNRIEFDNYGVAIHIYSETPNPASQIIHWWSEEERELRIKELEFNVKDPQWLEQLSDCI